ncbi:hypothetical protein [Streptomyces sp. NPDC058620]|uniref:hypothetical protein n=1 Tax=Streptomyces sp. NPDC058620 TaxID=3346560 RepID=UPI003663EC43
MHQESGAVVGPWLVGALATNGSETQGVSPTPLEPRRGRLPENPPPGRWPLLVCGSMNSDLRLDYLR